MAKKKKTASDVYVGATVLYVLENGPGKGEIRPAIVVKVWTNAEGAPQENGVCQLQVFSDSDGRYNDQLPAAAWRSSVVFSENKEPGTWHWSEVI